MASKRKQVCVIVAGMHRSGTSALTRVLSLLGCALPSNLLAANPTNESGHWEPQRIQEFNDRLLVSAGCSWDDWTPVPQDWFDSLEASARREEAVELFKEEYGSAPLTVFKDPRVCRLLPFWLGVFDDMGIQAVTAIPVRHPLEVARSLAVRDLSDPYHNRLLWLRHVTDAERYTRGRARYFCSYDDLLESWSAVISRMGDALGVKWPRMSAQTVLDIDAYLKPQFRHHRLNPGLLDDDRTEPEWLKTTYTVVARWASQGEDADGAAELDRISSAMNEAGASFGMLALRGKVAMTKVREVEAELARLQQERDEFSSRCASLTVAMDEREREIATLQEQRVASQALADEVPIRLAEANARADAMQSQADALTAMLDEANIRAEATRSEVDALNAALLDARGQADAVRSQADALTAALDEANIRVDATRLEATALAAALDEANTRADAARSEVAGLTAALQEASARASTAEANVAEARAEAAHNADALANANALSAQALSQVEETLRAREAEVSQLVDELSQGRAALASAMAGLENDRSASGLLHDQIAALVSKLRDAEAELGRRTKAIDSMKLALDFSDERLGQLEIEKDQSEQLAGALKSNIDLLLKDVNERDLIRDELVAAEQELSALTGRLADLEADIAHSTSALRQRSAEADDAYSELERVKDLLHTETRDKARLERAAEGLKANVSLLLSDLEERDARVAQIKSEAEHFRATVQANQKRLNQCFVASQLTVEHLVRGIALEPTPLFQTRRTALKKKADLLREAGVVDPDWYRSAYPEVRDVGLDPAEHYITKGYLEGRRPKL